MPSRSTSQSLNALPPGTVLRDYIIESELGSGGFSIVYLARHHLNPDWLYAIKEFLPGELAVRDRNGTTVHPVNTEAEEAFYDGLRRFRDEAEQLRKFRNEPYIVSCLNYFEQNGTAYLVMDHDDGLPLLELLRQRETAGQPFSEKDLLAVVEPLLEGLTAVHRASVLHRDIKPGNIFVRRQDDITGRPAHPVLIDFGAAKQNYLARHSRSRAPYTPGYAAYEQVSSEGDIGPWTDVYAVGALMWRMVAGGCLGDDRLVVLDGGDDADSAEAWSFTPRAAEKRAYALHRGRPDPMVSAVELGADRFSRTLLQVIDRCLALYPEDRFQNCDEVRKLLDVRTGRALGSRGYHTHPSDDTEHAGTSSGQSAHADRFGPGATVAGKGSGLSIQPGSKSSPGEPVTWKFVAAAVLVGVLVLAVLVLASINSRIWVDSEPVLAQEPPTAENDATEPVGSTLPAVDNERAIAEALDAAMNAYNLMEYEFALSEFRRLAALGNPQARFMLGVMYGNGEGVPEDDTQAAQWVTRAAEQGHVRAQGVLGYLFRRGEGVPQDYALAFLWYTRAAEQGDAGAQSGLGSMYANGEGVPEDDVQAIQWFTRAAEQGHASAQYSLSRMYYNGEGVVKDDSQGFHWLTRAYEQGFYIAAPELMMRYTEDFVGVPENAAEAVLWFTRKAEQGDAFAQGILGDMYADGVTVPIESDTQAVRWYARAAEQGLASSQYKLGNMYYNGEGVLQDYTQAVQWFTRAAAQGIPGAQISLGRMYANGEGVRQDNIQAYAWANLASVNGSPDAVALRNESAQRLSPAQLAEAQQLSSELKTRIQNTR